MGAAPSYHFSKTLMFPTCPSASVMTCPCTPSASSPVPRDTESPLKTPPTGASCAGQARRTLGLGLCIRRVQWLGEPLLCFDQASHNANLDLWIFIQGVIDARDAKLHGILHNDGRFYHTRKPLRASPNGELIDFSKTHFKTFHSRQVGDSIERNGVRSFCDLGAGGQGIELRRREHAKDPGKQNGTGRRQLIWHARNSVQTRAICYHFSETVMFPTCPIATVMTFPSSFVNLISEEKKC